MLAGFFGLLVAIGLAFLLDYLDLTLKTMSEAESTQLPVLGFIPYDADHTSALTPRADIGAATRPPPEDAMIQERPAPVRVKVRLGPARTKSSGV